MKKLVSALLVLVMLAAVIGTTSGYQKTDEKVSQPVITTPLLRIGILSDT